MRTHIIGPLRIALAVIGSVIWLIGALIVGGDDEAELR